MLVENVPIHEMATFLVTIGLLYRTSVELLEEVFQLCLLLDQFPRIPSPFVNPLGSIFGNLTHTWLVSFKEKFKT